MIPGIPAQMTLVSIIQMESSKGYWSKREWFRSQELLSFGETGDLGIPWDDDVDNEFLMRAFLEACRQSDKRFEHASEADRAAARRDLKEALRILCQSTGKVDTVKYCDHQLRLQTADPREAYAKLGAIPSVDDDTMIAIFLMRVRTCLASLDQGTNVIPWDRSRTHRRTPMIGATHSRLSLTIGIAIDCAGL